MDHYRIRDLVYRREEPGDHFEIYIDGWVPARGERALSEQDYELLRPLSEAAAQEQIDAAKP